MKKSLIITLVLVLTLSLTACGEKNLSGNNGNPKNDPTQQLIGEWVEEWEDEILACFIFFDDGKLFIDDYDGNRTEHGYYSVADDKIRIERDRDISIFTFSFQENKLLFFESSKAEPNLVLVKKEK